MAFSSIITISREYGSGGREIGKRVAQILGITLYDKSISELTAVATGIKPEVIDAFQDRTPTHFDYGTYSSGKFVHISDDLFEKQSKIIREMAQKPCVIIGRCADFILRDMPNVIDIFVCAPLDYRIKRISELYHLSEKEALKTIKTCDKQRAKYHSHYADTTWGDPRSYDFTINSATGLDETAKAIAGFALAVSKN